MEKHIFVYDDIKGEPYIIKVQNISPYLVEGKDFVILSRTKPICNVPEMFKGSQPTDGGNLLLDDTEKSKILSLAPSAEKFIKPFISADEFLNRVNRWCLWLVNIDPHELRNIPEIVVRIELVKKMR